MWRFLTVLDVSTDVVENATPTISGPQISCQSKSVHMKICCIIFKPLLMTHYKNDMLLHKGLYNSVA